MCDFFSLVSDGKGKIMYFDWKLRKQCIDKKLNYQPDSHTSIADYFGYRGAREDVLNKYEYNPITKVFKVDQLNTVDDTGEVEKFCKELDFKKVIPQLIIPEKIIHPFNDFDTIAITKKDLKLLKKWASVWASVRASVRDSVRASVGDLVRASVRDSVRASVGDLVWASVRDLVWDSVEDSIWASDWDLVWDLARASVWAYISSMVKLDKWKYIKHKKGVNPFQSCIDLWNKGLVPSYDGKIWRLHGKEGKVIWEGKI